MTAPTSKLRPARLLPRTASLVGAAVLLLAASACKKDNATPPGGTTEDPADPMVIAEDGADSAIAETDAELVTSSLVSATATSGSLTLASTGDLSPSGVNTAGLGDGAKAIYSPRLCLTVVGDTPNKTVMYTFADCTGPNGIFKITGTIKATYATAPGLLTLDLVGSGLHVNKAIVDWSAHAEIQSSGVMRTMNWKAQLMGTTAKGREFSRTNAKTITWRFGERCFTINGTSDGNVRNRELHTEISNFSRCAGACPEAGGKIVISNDAKLNVEIDFDGTRNAQVKGPKGTSTFDLGCGG